MRHPAWLAIGDQALWSADDGDEHIVTVTRINGTNVQLSLEDGQILNLPVRGITGHLGPVVNKTPGYHSSTLYSYTDVHTIREGISDDVALLHRDGQLQIILAGAVVAVDVSTHANIDQEAFFQIKHFERVRKKLEVTAHGRWLCTPFEALVGLQGRPSSSAGSTTLLLSDHTSCIPLESIKQVVTVKSRHLARPGQDDFVCKQHWDNATKHVTDLPPDVAAEMLYHKYTSNFNRLNDCAAKFASTTKEYLVAAFASRKSRNLQSFIGKDLHLDFDWYQLLAFESENLQLAQVEWFLDRVGRKNVWREYVTLRLTVQQVALELGDSWQRILTDRSDPAASDIILLGGTILLKWRPEEPFLLRMVIEKAERIKAFGGAVPLWQKTVPIGAPVLHDPSADNSGSMEAGSINLVTSSDSSSDSDPDGDETLQSLIARLEHMSPSQAGRGNTGLGSGKTAAPMAPDSDDDYSDTDETLMALAARPRLSAGPHRCAKRRRVAP